ncbi:MAG: zinc-ribbon domain-containing protein [Methanobacteriota archaeon]
MAAQIPCRNCGTLNSPDYAFCAMCGASLHGRTPAGPASFSPAAPFPPAGFGFATPTAARVNSLAKAGAGLVAFGGILVGIGWLLPDTTEWWIPIGVEWVVLGIGLALGILGLAQSR